jgi:branched-chain amino acid transport system ATP-binding protein
MLLQLKNISFGFSPEKKIFDNLSLNIEAGKVHALMGGNGSGKTTLFNIITGFHKIPSGKIVFKGYDITNNEPYKINQFGICRTFQDLRLISKLTVKENILLAMRNDPTDSWKKAFLPIYISKKELHILKHIADKIIDTYFLSDVQNFMANEISFGQQKLLNIACCVANGAETILLDEPVAGINPQFRKEMTLIINQLKQQGKTIVMIEHNTDFISETSDLFLFLNEGSILEFNTFKQLHNSKQARDAYF